MTKYQYPAIFHKDKECGYWVEFPDWEKVNVGAFTDGKNYKQARYMAEDLLGLLCWDHETDHKVFPEPSKPEDHFAVSYLPGNFIKMISADTHAYNQIMKFINNRHLHYRYRQINKAIERYKKWD